MRGCLLLIYLTYAYSLSIIAQNKSEYLDYKIFSKVCEGNALNNSCIYNADSAFHKILLLEPDDLTISMHGWHASDWNNNLPYNLKPKDISEVVYVGCISKEPILKTCYYEDDHKVQILEGEKVKIDIYFAATGILYTSKIVEEDAKVKCPPEYVFSYNEKYQEKYTSASVSYEKNIKEWIENKFGQGVVSTDAVVDITENSAICKAEVIRNTSSSLAKMGICWSTSSKPKITNSKTESVPIIGEYTGKLTGLKNNVKYYVRAYALNTNGTIYYGNELSFIAKKTFDTFLDKRDNHIYKYVKIGDQMIMSENFAFKPDSGSYWALNNDEQNILKYGYLYDWETAQKVVPQGWHVPTQKEWQKLYEFLGEKPNIVFNSFQNRYQSFNPLLCGYRKPDGTFVDIGTSTNFWSSTIDENNQSWYFYYDIMYRIANLSKISKECGCSLRLIHD